MKLIGMLDSPYVRRTAISLKCLGVEFEHQAISVISTFEQFQKINPAVKAPTLVFGERDLLMDSNLIIQYAESLAGPDKSLLPKDSTALKNALQTISFALAACEKAVQFVYEKNLRPPEKQYAPWLGRVTSQLQAACTMLEEKIRSGELELQPQKLDQVFITLAVVWQFMQSMIPELLPAENYPCLLAMSRYAETLPEFLAFPSDGPGVTTAN